MKKLLTLLLTVFTTVCFAQVSVQITIPNTIDANTANWTNGFVVTATTQKSLERCCLILTIKGPVTCGTLTPQSAPTFTLEANKPKVFSGQNAIALFGTNCVLTPGSYTLNATVYFNGNPAGIPASRQFEIKKEEPAAQVNLSINMPNPIDASTANWTNGFVITATTKNPLERCSLILTIKGKVNCGTLTPKTAPVFTLEANKPKVFSGQNAIALFGTNCVLEPGSYELIATLYYNDRPTGTASRPFEIRKEEPANYQPPQAIAPKDSTVINEADAKKPVTFRWIPVTPKPKDPVTYKLRIYEVKQGQTATAVVKSAIPLHEKDIINQTQYVLPSLSQLNATKGSSFAWTVQALGVKGNPVGGNNGMSGMMTFRSGEDEISIKIDSLKVECCNNGKHQIKIYIRNREQNSNTKIDKIEIDAINGNYSSPYPQNISSVFSPSLPYSFLPSGGSTVFSALIDCIPNLNTIDIHVYASRTINSTFRDDDAEIDSIRCACTFCDSVSIIIPSQGTISMDSTLWLQTPVNVNPAGIKSIKTQLVYFEYKPETDDCVPCNRDCREWGNFIKATLSDSEFPANGIQSHGHEWQWTTSNTNGANVNGQFNFNISLPPLVKCCKLEVKFCIRYIFEYIDCSVCDKVVCYSYSKTN